MYYQGSPPEVEVPPMDDEMQVSNPHDPPQSVGLDWIQVTMQNWPRGMHIDPGQGHIPHHATDKDGDTFQSPLLPDVQAVQFLVELTPFCRHGVNATKLA
jgi:hypothetical protein